jgi:cellulose synthase/poly-beta-1,6-N-acetylglucosamine synthase-like glycosyltransferase
MKVYAVIVTYGNRFNYIKQVIDACFSEGVDKIIIVDNKSIDESKKKLNKVAKEYKHKLQLIALNENRGSAGGFIVGLKIAYNDPSCEYIWLLDDDNLPAKNSLLKLKDFWNKINDIENKEQKVALLSYRKDREIYKQAIIQSDPSIVLGKKNSFYGIHISKIFDIFFNKF